MINFACKTFEFDEIVKCSFGINKTEYKILMILIDRHGSFSVYDIANDLKLDRTTVQKAVKTLHEKKLVQKHQVNFKKGGYTYLYSIKSKEELKNKMIDIVESWNKSVIDYIKKW